MAAVNAIGEAAKGATGFDNRPTVFQLVALGVAVLASVVMVVQSSPAKKSSASLRLLGSRVVWCAMALAAAVVQPSPATAGKPHESKKSLILACEKERRSLLAGNRGGWFDTMRARGAGNPLGV
ncbi:hypothetical protein [Catellatospora vulcania]|uniref:hypothetical protein n=1 Tax=Catellatospora vulcania TaxID=1460450 RepID=UPI0012D3A240|nr:hypothetical protein [Catellatospora vulcania]